MIYKRTSHLGWLRAIAIYSSAVAGSAPANEVTDKLIYLQS